MNLLERCDNLRLFRVHLRRDVLDIILNYHRLYRKNDQDIVTVINIVQTPN